MNESPGKENKESELLYRLGKRNPFMVMFDFIGFSFFLLVPALPTAIYYDGWMQALGILGSLFLSRLLYKLIFFNYIEIYRDRIVINRYIFGDTVIKKRGFGFLPYLLFSIYPHPSFYSEKKKTFIL